MLKTYNKKDPFPDDFWNYDVNVILGYKYEREQFHGQKIEKRYFKQTQPI